MSWRIPNAVQSALDEATTAGLHYALEDGGKHYKIRIAGRLAGIIPKGTASKDAADRRPLLNMRAQIRRIINEAKGETE
jgi:hypothetical protein